MIAYRISRSELIQRIEARVPNWIKNARNKTRENFKVGASAEGNIWSDIKDIFRQLQGESKCAFCERKLPSGDGGNYEIDVEHFRPKNLVKSWPVPAHLNHIVTSLPPSDNKGYFLLTYEVSNYSVSCETCNECIKKNFFPIEGTYNLNGRNPRRLSAERPLLIFPIGNHDIDPESAINFNGASPKACSIDTHVRNRALVTIAFFKLNDEAERANIFLERSDIIITLRGLLVEECASYTTLARKIEARELIVAYSSSKCKHANCARSYIRLFAQDRARADAVYDAASAFVKSKS